MNIYQLAHTTPYIGGQIRIDIILNRRADGKLHAENLYVVPLAENIVYNETKDYPYLNYTHNQNIKYLYEQIGDDMFKCFSQFTETKYWLYNKNKYPTDTMDHTYDMGLKRMRYKRYGKQFSFLCPVWVSAEEGETITLDDICFEIVFEGIGSQSLGRQVVTNSSEIVWSDDIRRYFDEFLSQSDDRLLSIRFDNEECFIDGIHAESGTHIQKDVGYVLPALTMQLRSVLDFDTILCRTLTQNRFVAKQLINFNFCFDADDIISPAYVNTRTGRNNMYVNVFHRNENNKIVYYPLKDFYSNYDFIPAYYLEKDGAQDENPTAGHFVSTENSLELTDEHTARYTKYLNKINQPVVHFTMSTNTEYIYNMSTVFSGQTNGGRNNENTVIQGVYFGTPDLAKREYDYRYNNIAFCNGYRLFEFNDQSLNAKFIFDDNEDSMYVMRSKYGIQWLHNNKFNIPESFVRSQYDYTQTPPQLVGITSLKLAIMYGDSVTPSSFTGWTSVQLNTTGTTSWMLYKNISGDYTVVLLINSNSQQSGKEVINLVTGGAFKNGDCFQCDHILGNPIPEMLFQYIHDFLNYHEAPYRFIFSEILNTEPCKIDSPLLNARTETDLYMYSGRQTTLYRYSDKLLPKFIDAPNDDSPFYNKRYRYIQWNDDTLISNSEPNIYPIGSNPWDKTQRIVEYNKFINDRLIPEYPSIGFYSLNGFRDTFGSDSPLVDEYEETYWYKRNRVYVLPPQIMVIQHNWETVTNPTPPHTTTDRFLTYEEIEERYWEQLYWAVFGRPGVDERLEHQDASPQTLNSLTDEDMRKRRMEMLKARYSVHYNFDYLSNTNIDKVIYYVTFDLY